jgi:hypothetical protein
MNIIKKPFVSTKNFVARHKTAILATTAVTAVTVAVVQQAGLKMHDEFLKDHGLYDEFYTLDEITL